MAIWSRERTSLQRTMLPIMQWQSINVVEMGRHTSPRPAETLTIDETLSMRILTFLPSVDSNDGDNVVSWSSTMASLGTDDAVRPISHIPHRWRHFTTRDI